MIGQGWPQERQYVDFRDRDGTWLVGLVMARNETHIRMRCEGWGARYDETIPAPQESITRHAKIQPFRTHTRGYTGLRKACAVREHWKFTPEDHESRTQKLEAFIEHLREKSAFQMWQFLRGEHYFYLDFLMSGSYPTQQELGKVYHYFKNHIKLCKLYLQNMQEQGVMQWLAKDSSGDGQKETWLGAYKQCYIQIFDGLFCVAGLNERLSVFFKINEKGIKQLVGIYETHENYVSNELLVTGTFEVLKRIINETYIVVIDQSSLNKLPFLFSYTILQMFLIIEKTLLLEKDPQLEQLLDKIFVIIRKLFDEIDAQSLKGAIIDRQIEFVLINLKLAFIRHNRKEIVSDWIQEFKIRYYVVFIKSNSLERKIKGIVKLKQYCQEIIHCPPNRDPKMSKQKFKLQFNDLKCEEILFQQCQHAEIFKKSIQLVCFLYKCGMANLESLVYAWNHSINKEPAVVKHLHNYWNDVALRVWPNDHSKFVAVVANFYSSDSSTKDTNESVEFVFKFVDCLTKNFNFFKYRNEDPPSNISNIEQNITLMIQELYEILLANLNRENQEILIEYYSRLVLWSSSSNHFILQLFNNLTHHIYFRISLFILSEIYLMAESGTFFLPQNFSIILLNCLKISPLSLKEISMLMKLLNRILLASKQHQKGFEMKKEDFRQFWDYFQSVTQEKRAFFYEWITQSRKAESEDQNLKTYDLFSKDLKDYIVAEILCEESFSDLAHLTKKQLEIILEFFIEKNLTQQKLEEKNYYSDFRIVYRLRTVQLIKEDFLWTIFEKCKNSEVIHALNKNLIAFYFFYSPTVSYNLKKGRIDEFLIKLKTNLDTGHKDSNTGLIKNTLMLLKNVIELIKQDKKLEPAHSLNIACVKAQIYHDTRTYQLQVKYEDTVANIKIRVANYFTLKPLAFKLLNSKQEQMGFDTKDIPICCFSDKYFKVVEIPAQQQTLTKFINNFLNEEIEEILFRMLQNEKTALQVYDVLDELEFKQEKRLIFKRINDILEKHGEIQQQNLTSIHCFYLLQLKLINRHMDDRQFIEQSCSYHNFSRFLRMMNHPIKINIHINFLHSITNLLIKFHKKGNFAHKRETSERCLSVIYELYRYSEVRKVEGHVKDLLNKINNNCVLLLQDIITLPQMLVFLFSLPHIEQMLLLIFFSNHFEEIKLLFIERLKKYIAMYRLAKRRNQSIETRMADIFINMFYPKIMQYFENKKLKCESKSHHELFIVISKIIQVISPETPSAAHPNSEKIITLHKKIHQFLCKIINSKELRELESSRFLITGHLNLLKTIISNIQQLKSADILIFVIVQCLGVSSNVKKIPLCSHPEEIQSAFQIIRAHLCENTSAQFLKCIMELFNPCQRVPLWRINNRWSINISPQSKQQYRGLMNPGCICYMNSLLQQLFMIQEFRNGILSINAVQHETIDQQNKMNVAKRYLGRYATILQSLKSLFLNLIFSEENIINPVPFAMTIKNSENRPMIRINQQMDIDEFQSILFDKLQKQLQNQKSRNLIRELFGGVYSNQIVSSQCPHKSEREESFISISLEVKKNIYESFRSFVKVDVLDGDNKYFCQTCNKKVKAEKIQSIKKLPPYLILCLKRFQFNFQIETKIKINDYCEFYQKIKLKQFSSQELNRNSSALDQQNDTKQAVLPDDYYNYKLRGVVVHTGSADSGHYYSFIENKQGHWFQFNDQDVYPFDIKKLPDEAFGSKGVYDDGRIRNAYLLIYERQVKEAVAEQAEPEEKVYENQSNKDSIEQILVRNQEIQKFQLVFSESYSRLIELMSSTYKKLQISERKKISQQWQDFFLGYYFLVLIRKENFERFVQVSEQLEKEIIHNGEMSNSYLRLFSSCNFYQEFFIYNPLRERCRILSHLLYTALIRYSQENAYVSSSRKPLLNMVLMAIKIVLINHGHVLELAITLRKYLEYIAQVDTAAFRHIIFCYSFQNVFLDQIFGNAFQPNQKQEYSKHLHQNKQTINSSVIMPIQLSQKKQNIDQPLQTWRILYFLLKEDNKILGSGGQRQEIRLLKANFEYLVTVITKAQCSKIMNAIYESHQQPNVDYLYKTFKEVGLLNRLREAIQKGLKDYESSKYRPFMLLILNFIYDPSTSDEDVDALIAILENSYKHNEKYFLEVDLFNQWIIKFISTSEKFSRRLNVRKQFIEHILSWITKTPHPTSDHLKKHKLPNNERLLNRYYGIIVSSDVKDYEKNNHFMKEYYQSILNSPVALTPPIIRLNQPFVPNKPIKYFDMVLLKWIDSTVVSNQFGYLTVQVGSKESNHINLWEDSEKIRITKEDQIQAEKSEDSDFSYESNQNEKF